MRAKRGEEGKSWSVRKANEETYVGANAQRTVEAIHKAIIKTVIDRGFTQKQTGSRQNFVGLWKHYYQPPTGLKRSSAAPVSEPPSIPAQVLGSPVKKPFRKPQRLGDSPERKKKPKPAMKKMPVIPEKPKPKPKPPMPKKRKKPVPQFSPHPPVPPIPGDRTSTRLNSSHKPLSYAVFCLQKTNTYTPPTH